MYIYDQQNTMNIPYKIYFGLNLSIVNYLRQLNSFKNENLVCK